LEFGAIEVIPADSVEWSHCPETNCVGNAVFVTFIFSDDAKGFTAQFGI
jgi:hypothetical protein